MKPPYALAIGGPLIFVILNIYGYSVGVLHYDIIILTVLAVVIGWGGSLHMWLTQRRAATKRLFIDIRPNMVETMDGALIENPFSSDKHFLNDAVLFDKTINEIAGRPQASKGRFIFARESVHARVWPGSLGVSELESGRMLDALEMHFISATVEIIDSQDDATDALRA